MSVVIIGGNDRMHRLYKDTCKAYGCRAKVFTQPQSTIRRFNDCLYGHGFS